MDNDSLQVFERGGKKSCSVCYDSRLSSPPSSHVHVFVGCHASAHHFRLCLFCFLRTSLLKFKGGHGQHNTTCHFQHVPCACFIRCAPVALSIRSASCVCPSVRSKIIRSSAVCEGAKTAISCAYAALGKYHSSGRKPQYVPFSDNLLLRAVSTVSTRIVHTIGLSECPWW